MTTTDPIALALALGASRRKLLLAVNGVEGDVKPRAPRGAKAKAIKTELARCDVVEAEVSSRQQRDFDARRAADDDLSNRPIDAHSFRRGYTAGMRTDAPPPYDLNQTAAQNFVERFPAGLADSLAYGESLLEEGESERSAPIAAISSASLPRARPPKRLVLPYPVSSNRYWRAVSFGKRMAMVPTKEAKDYKKMVANLAIAQGVRCSSNRMIVLLELYPHRPLDYAKRMKKDPAGWEETVQCIDLGNCEKVIGDALNGIAWDDDKQLFGMLKLRRPPDVHGERCVVTFCDAPRMLEVHGAFDPDAFLQGALL